MKFGKLFKTSAIFSVIFALATGALPVVIAQSGPPKQEKLLNGLKVLMWNDAKADSVSVRVRVHSGSAFDPQGKEGVMQLLADSLFPNEAAREFFEEDLGGSLEVVTSTTSPFFSLSRIGATWPLTRAPEQWSPTSVWMA